MNEAQVISFKILVDGEEGQTEFQLSEDSIRRILLETQKLQDVNLSKYTEQITSVASGTEGAAAAVELFIRENQLSETTLNGVIANLQKQQSLLAIGSAEYNKIAATIETTRLATQQLRTTQTGLVAGTNSMNQALGQFGWMLGDADMFMVNFRMGMMSIGNNIPMIVNGFIQAKKEAQSLNTTLGSQLVTSLTGPGGLMVGINLLMLALNVLPGLFKSTTEAAATSTEVIANLGKELEKMSADTMRQRLATDAIALSILSKQLKQAKDAIIYDSEGVAISGGELYDSLKKQVDLLTASTKAYSDALNKIGYEKDLLAKKAELEDLALNARTKAEHDAYQKQADDIDKLLKKRVDIYHHKDTTDKNFYEDWIKGNEKALESVLKLEDKGKAALQELFDWQKNREAAAMPIEASAKDVTNFLEMTSRMWRAKIDEIQKNTYGLTPLGQSKEWSLQGLNYPAPELPNPDKDARTQEEIWQRTHTSGMAAIDALHEGMNGFWRDFALKGETGKVTWNNLWNTFKETYFTKMFDMINSGLMDELMSFLAGTGDKKDKSGSSGNFVFDVIKTAASIFSFGLFKTSGNGGNYSSVQYATELATRSGGGSFSTSGVERVLNSNLKEFTNAIENMNFRVGALELAALVNRGNSLLKDGEV